MLMTVILAPSPMPPILWVLTVTLLKAGYVVLVVVPKVEDAEALEKRMNALQEKSALRVLIYDPEDVSGCQIVTPGASTDAETSPLRSHLSTGLCRQH